VRTVGGGFIGPVWQPSLASAPGNPFCRFRDGEVTGVYVLGLAMVAAGRNGAHGRRLSATVVAMNLAIAIVVAVATVAAALAALGSWKAATKANDTAATMAAIEPDRRHDELKPVFEITFRVRGTAIDSADMRATLAGGGMDRLDAVTVTILDDSDADHWSRGLPDGVTQQQAEAFVWGAWEFNTGASDQVDSNRTTKPRAYNRVNGRNWDLLSMNATRPGRWMGGMDQARWQAQYAGKPVRLLIMCYRGGYEPWALPHEVRVEGPCVGMG
jgi:hypothetical protein